MTLEIVSGVGGLSVYLNGYRIAGEKPWGGGRVLKAWTIELSDLREAMRRKRTT